MTPNELWWNNIPSAVNFIDEIVYRLNDSICVVYCIDGSFPWNDTFKALLKQRLDSGTREMDIVDLDDSRYEGKSPGEILCETYCGTEIRNKYRTSVGYEKLLAENDSDTVLIDKYIAVVNGNEEQISDWCRFIAGYKKHHSPSVPCCTFIVENRTGKSFRESAQIVYWRDFFHCYDIYMFSLLIASELKIPEIMKKYLAELAASLSEENPETAALLTSDSERFIKDPGEVYRQLTEKKECPEKLIWEAQIKVFFPCLENFRSRFIKKYEPYIKGQINGVPIEDINEVELGELIFLCGSGQLRVTSPDYEKLKLFRQCRNDLAHLSIIEYERLQQLCDIKVDDNNNEYISYRR